MRSAPSSRMVSPFSIGFSMMWRERGVLARPPEARRNRDLGGQLWRWSSGSMASMGV